MSHTFVLLVGQRGGSESTHDLHSRVFDFAASRGAIEYGSLKTFALKVGSVLESSIETAGLLDDLLFQPSGTSREQSDKCVVAYLTALGEGLGGDLRNAIINLAVRGKGDDVAEQALDELQDSVYEMVEMGILPKKMVDKAFSDRIGLPDVTQYRVGVGMRRRARLPLDPPDVSTVTYLFGDEDERRLKSLYAVYQEGTTAFTRGTTSSIYQDHAIERALIDFTNTCMVVPIEERHHIMQAIHTMVMEKGVDTADTTPGASGSFRAISDHYNTIFTALQHTLEPVQGYIKSDSSFLGGLGEDKDVYELAKSMRQRLGIMLQDSNRILRRQNKSGWFFNRRFTKVDDFRRYLHPEDAFCRVLEEMRNTDEVKAIPWSSPIPRDEMAADMMDEMMTMAMEQRETKFEETLPDGTVKTRTVTAGEQPIRDNGSEEDLKMVVNDALDIHGPSICLALFGVAAVANIPSESDQDQARKILKRFRKRAIVVMNEIGDLRDKEKAGRMVSATLSAEWRELLSDTQEAASAESFAAMAKHAETIGNFIELKIKPFCGQTDKGETLTGIDAARRDIELNLRIDEKMEEERTLISTLTEEIKRCEDANRLDETYHEQVIRRDDARKRMLSLTREQAVLNKPFTARWNQAKGARVNKEHMDALERLRFLYDSNRSTSHAETAFVHIAAMLRDYPTKHEDLGEKDEKGEPKKLNALKFRNPALHMTGLLMAMRQIQAAASQASFVLQVGDMRTKKRIQFLSDNRVSFLNVVYSVSAYIKHRWTFNAGFSSYASVLAETPYMDDHVRQRVRAFRLCLPYTDDYGIDEAIQKAHGAVKPKNTSGQARAIMEAYASDPKNPEYGKLLNGITKSAKMRVLRFLTTKYLTDDRMPPLPKLGSEIAGGWRFDYGIDTVSQSEMFSGYRVRIYVVSMDFQEYSKQCKTQGSYVRQALQLLRLSMGSQTSLWVNMWALFYFGMSVVDIGAQCFTYVAALLGANIPFIANMAESNFYSIASASASVQATISICGALGTGLLLYQAMKYTTKHISEIEDPTKRWMAIGVAGVAVAFGGYALVSVSASTAAAVSGGKLAGSAASAATSAAINNSAFLGRAIHTLVGQVQMWMGLTMHMPTLISGMLGWIGQTWAFAAVAKKAFDTLRYFCSSALTYFTVMVGAYAGLNMMTQGRVGNSVNALRERFIGMRFNGWVSMVMHYTCFASTMSTVASMFTSVMERIPNGVVLRYEDGVDPAVGDSIRAANGRDILHTAVWNSAGGVDWKANVSKVKQSIRIDETGEYETMDDANEGVKVQEDVKAVYDATGGWLSQMAAGGAASVAGLVAGPAAASYAYSTTLKLTDQKYVAMGVAAVKKFIKTKAADYENLRYNTGYLTAADGMDADGMLSVGSTVSNVVTPTTKLRRMEAIYDNAHANFFKETDQWKKFVSFHNKIDVYDRLVTTRHGESDYETQIINVRGDVKDTYKFSDCKDGMMCNFKVFDLQKYREAKGIDLKVHKEEAPEPSGLVASVTSTVSSWLPSWGSSKEKEPEMVEKPVTGTMHSSSNEVDPYNRTAGRDEYYYEGLRDEVIGRGSDNKHITQKGGVTAIKKSEYEIINKNGDFITTFKHPMSGKIMQMLGWGEWAIAKAITPVGVTWDFFATVGDFFVGLFGGQVREGEEDLGFMSSLWQNFLDRRKRANEASAKGVNRRQMVVADFVTHAFDSITFVPEISAMGAFGIIGKMVGVGVLTYYLGDVWQEFKVSLAENGFEADEIAAQISPLAGRLVQSLLVYGGAARDPYLTYASAYRAIIQVMRTQGISLPTNASYFAKLNEMAEKGDMIGIGREWVNQDVRRAINQTGTVAGIFTAATCALSSEEADAYLSAAGKVLKVGQSKLGTKANDLITTAANINSEAWAIGKKALEKAVSEGAGIGRPEGLKIEEMTSAFFIDDNPNLPQGTKRATDLGGWTDITEKEAEVDPETKKEADRRLAQEHRKAKIAARKAERNAKAAPRAKGAPKDRDSDEEDGSDEGGSSNSAANDASGLRRRGTRLAPSN